MIATVIKIILAALFMICLFHMPYRYYEIVRFVGFVGFMLLAFLKYREVSVMSIQIIIFISLGLLFQPFIKISLGRTVWNIVDMVVSMALIGSVLISEKEQIKIK